MVVPRSILDGDWVVLTPALTPGQAPTSFPTETQPAIQDGRNQEWRCPESFSVLPAFPGQPDTTYTVVSETSDGTHTYRDEVTVSNRNLQPNKWVSKKILDADGSTVWSHSWLRRGGGDPFNRVPPFSPTGTSLDIDERWIERYTATPTPGGVNQMFVHNPTLTGTGFRPDAGYVADTTKIYSGPPVMFFTLDKFGSQRPAVIEAAGIPTDFGGDPKTDPPWAYADHGQGVGYYRPDGTRVEDYPIWWWRMRMWRKFELQWKGHPRIARVSNGSYFPAPINNAVDLGAAAPVLVYLSETCHTVPGIFDEVHALDIATGALTQLTNARAPGGEFSETWEAAYRFMKHRMVQRWTGQATVAVGSTTASGYCAIVLRDSVSGFCMAYATKIFDCNESLSVDSRLDTQLPCMMQFDHRTFPTTTPLSELTFEGDIISVTHKSETERKAGWIFSHSFIYTGDWADLIGDLQQLYTDGDLDTAPDETDLPAAVLASLEPTIVTQNSRLV